MKRNNGADVGDSIWDPKPSLWPLKPADCWTAPQLLQAFTRFSRGASFDLAKSLAGAKNLAEIVELQAAYWQKQFGALTAQAEEVHALSTKVTADTAEPIKARATRKHG